MKVRTVFLSDIHLGTRGCQAGLLLEFLDNYEADTYYLVGDIIDGWKLRRGWFWPQAHNDVVQEMLARVQSGAKVFYIPGNHDEMLRNYLGTHFGGIEVMSETEHKTADGRRFLITHGDQFDAIVVRAKWLAKFGDRAYGFALWLNTWFNWFRQRVWGGSYWSLSNWAKQQVKQSVNYISEYEKVLTGEAKRGGFDGVICGHIHCASIEKMGDMDYVNTGDWVESCTAVVEHEDGSLHLIDWARRDRQKRLRTDIRTKTRPRLRREIRRRRQKRKEMT